jgi:hypothetical protein
MGAGGALRNAAIRFDGDSEITVEFVRPTKPQERGIGIKYLP